MKDKHPFGKEAPLVDPLELPGWIVLEDESLLVVNKPGWLVCHPSKNGPLSSLAGAVRAYMNAGKLHLVARLDRETSGLVVFAKRPAVARRFQMAIQERRVRKRYLVILEGDLREEARVERPIARRKGGPVFVKSEVREDGGGQSACTVFKPLVRGKGYTLCQVEPETGRKHQIRVHAAWLGHRVAGDKLYGPDEHLYLEFIERGWTDHLEQRLPLYRQALHCHYCCFDFPEGPFALSAELPEDMERFVRERMDCELPRMREG
ncbi:MAG: RluA family pseudouridine synthase [Opitutales bacterium]